MSERLSTSRRRALLATTAALLALGGIAIRFVPRHGVVRNESTRVVWVVDTDRGYASAHRLAPGRQSPRGLDADGVRTEDRSLIDGHASWWKARDVSVAVVRDSQAGLTIACIACSAVNDDEFGPVRFDRSGTDWGEPLHE